MLLLGIDLGTSFIKVSVIDAISQSSIASVQYPDSEVPIISSKPGWAEQSPDQWWFDIKQAILKLNNTKKFNPRAIKGIGITYQMHGLVLIDKKGCTLRNSILWCDSRAVSYGNDAAKKLGNSICASRLLNEPGNFTAAKLAWVKENEPTIYDSIYKILLPGDFISFRMTNQISTTPSALSEGIFWDFEAHTISRDVLNHFGFDQTLFPDVKDVFDNHGYLLSEVANELGLNAHIPITYKAGDQPNNAFSLNVLEHGDFAATAGTSGVIYGVMGALEKTLNPKVNRFAHVNHSNNSTSIGSLLCINGAGIMNRYVKQNFGSNITYSEFDKSASAIPSGSEGLHIFPFGNGVERMFENRMIGAHIDNLDLNIHTSAHLFRAVQEGIAFSFKYGFEHMCSNQFLPNRIKVAKGNMFLSPVFIESFVNTIGIPVEIYDVDGSAGAAKGAGVEIGAYSSPQEACSIQKTIETIFPTNVEVYTDLYNNWLCSLRRHIN